MIKKKIVIANLNKDFFSSFSAEQFCLTTREKFIHKLIFTKIFITKNIFLTKENFHMFFFSIKQFLNPKKISQIFF